MRIPKSCLSVATLSVPKKRNHPSFVNISLTAVIDASIKRSSRVIQHGNPKNLFYFQKRSKLNYDLCIDLCRSAEITLASSISVLQ